MPAKKLSLNTRTASGMQKIYILWTLSRENMSSLSPIDSIPRLETRKSENQIIPILAFLI